MITLSIDVTKLDKSRLVKGKYLNLTLVKNKQGIDQYGHSGFVTQSTSKEDRANGVKLPILGNYKDWEDPAAQGPRPPVKKAAPAQDDSDNIPW